MIKDVLMKIKMSTCVKVQETHFYQVSWRFSKKYKLLKGGMPSLLKFLTIPLISFLHFRGRVKMQFSQLFLGGIKKFLYSLERYFHIVLKTNLNISFSTTQIVVIAKRLESEVISRYL